METSNLPLRLDTGRVSQLLDKRRDDEINENIFVCFVIFVYFVISLLSFYKFFAGEHKPLSLPCIWCITGAASKSPGIKLIIQSSLVATIA